MAKNSKTNDVETIRNAPARLHSVLEEYRKKASLTNGRSLLTSQARQEHVKKLRADAERRVASIREDTEAAYHRLHGSLTATVKGADTSNDQTVQLKRQRAWGRLKPLLDAHREPSFPGRKDLTDVIADEAKRAAKAGDLETIRMLEEELPAYLTANRLSDYAPIVETLLTDANVAMRNGEQWNASTESDELTQSWNRVQVALNTAGLGSVTAFDQDIIFPNYEDGAVLTVSAAPKSTEETTADGQPVRTTSLPELSARY